MKALIMAAARANAKRTDLQGRFDELTARHERLLAEHDAARARAHDIGWSDAMLSMEYAVTKEREACAQVAEDFAMRRDVLPPHIVEQWRPMLDGRTFSNTAAERSLAIRDAIRARGNPKENA